MASRTSRTFLKTRRTAGIFLSGQQIGAKRTEVHCIRSSSSHGHHHNVATAYFYSFCKISEALVPMVQVVTRLGHLHANETYLLDPCMPFRFSPCACPRTAPSNSARSTNA